MRSIKRLYKPVCRSPIFKGLAMLGRSAIEFYENRNYDMHSNGEMRLLQRIAKFDPGVVFDVGANTGEWSRLALTCFPYAKIFAFEPAPGTFSKLEANLRDESRVTLVPKGLAGNSGTVKFNYYPDREGQSSLYDYELGNYANHIDVELITGDEYCCEMSIKRINLLKIDVEGADLEVLRGFLAMIKRKSVDVIQFEYGKINVNSRALLKDFYDYLLPLGYRVGKLFPKMVEFRPYSLKHENFIGPNFVAVLEEREDIVNKLGVILLKAPKI